MGSNVSSWKTSSSSFSFISSSSCHGHGSIVSTWLGDHKTTGWMMVTYPKCALSVSKMRIQAETHVRVAGQSVDVSQKQRQWKYFHYTKNGSIKPDWSSQSSCISAICTWELLCGMLTWPGRRQLTRSAGSPWRAGIESGTNSKWLSNIKWSQMWINQMIIQPDIISKMIFYLLWPAFLF
jgi:hypothetical protein